MWLLCSVVEIYCPNCFRAAYFPRCRNESSMGPLRKSSPICLGKSWPYPWLQVSWALVSGHMVLSPVSNSDLPYVSTTGWAFPLFLLLPMGCCLLTPSHSSFVPVVHLPLHCHLFLTFFCLEKFHDIWLLREMLLSSHLSFQNHHFNPPQASQQHHLKPVPTLPLQPRPSVGVWLGRVEGSFSEWWKQGTDKLTSPEHDLDLAEPWSIHCGIGSQGSEAVKEVCMHSEGRRSCDGSLPSSLSKGQREQVRVSIWTLTCVHVCSVVSSGIFATPWKVAHQAPLSMWLFRQEYWSGLPLPLPGVLPDPGIEPASLASAFAGRFSTTGIT